MLQETHSTEETEKKWRAEWGGAAASQQAHDVNSTLKTS